MPLLRFISFLITAKCSLVLVRATGVDSLGQYSFGDMVQIDAQTVGVIVQIQKETFQVLNMHGKVVSMRAAALQKKREKKAAAALDSEQNAIQVCQDFFYFLLSAELFDP